MKRNLAQSNIVVMPRVETPSHDVNERPNEPGEQGDDEAREHMRAKVQHMAKWRSNKETY